MNHVVPTLHQLPVHYMTSFEMYPLETVETKRRWLGQAEQEGWLLIFGHGTGQKAGRIVSELFGAYTRDSELLPDRVRSEFGSTGEPRAIADYLAGMTDRFAQAEHRKLVSGSK